MLAQLIETSRFGNLVILAMHLADRQLRAYTEGRKGRTHSPCQGAMKMTLTLVNA